MNSKKFFFTWEEFDNEYANPKGLLERILQDKELPQIEELIIGYWGDSWDDSCQEILDGMIENKEKFAHIKKLFVGDMEYDECEVSWIVQGNYTELLKALPNLKGLTIKGSQELELGEICHENLESLEIICGGLPSSVIEDIAKAKLPNLKKLNLYLGDSNYGFDGEIEPIKNLLQVSDFPKLEYLGLNDSEIQDEVVEEVLRSKYMAQVSELDFSNGTLSDKGGQMLLETLPKFPNITKVNLEYHYLSDEMMEKLEQLPIEINMYEQNEADEYDGEIWRSPMLTE